MRAPLLATLLLVEIAGVQPSFAKNIKNIDTTVCAIRSDPAKFRGALVRIHADVDTDGLEDVLLKDDKCQGSWINFGDFLADADSDSPNRLQIREAVSKIYLHNRIAKKGDHLVVSGTWIGEIRYYGPHDLAFRVKAASGINVRQGRRWLSQDP